jgi:hypothetical protein
MLGQTLVRTREAERYTAFLKRPIQRRKALHRRDIGVTDSHKVDSESSPRGDVEPHERRRESPA